MHGSRAPPLFCLFRQTCVEGAAIRTFAETWILLCRPSVCLKRRADRPRHVWFFRAQPCAVMKTPRCCAAKEGCCLYKLFRLSPIELTDKPVGKNACTKKLTQRRRDADLHFPLYTGVEGIVQQTDLFAANAAHIPGIAKAVRPEQIRLFFFRDRHASSNCCHGCLRFQGVPLKYVLCTVKDYCRDVLQLPPGDWRRHGQLETTAPPLYTFHFLPHASALSASLCP